jgi:hypothetical protein
MPGHSGAQVRMCHLQIVALRIQTQTLVKQFRAPCNAACNLQSGFDAGWIYAIFASSTHAGGDPHTRQRRA